MIWSPIVVIVYGIFCIVGGFIGFFKADSLASLLFGGIGGLILIFCGGWMFVKSRVAVFITLLISLAFGIRFLIALITQFKVMPHLIMVILSLASIAASVALFSANEREKRSR